MAKFRNQILNVGDIVLVEFAGTPYERTLVAVSDKYVKLNKAASCIEDWCEEDRVKAVIRTTRPEDNPNGPWESIDGTRAVKDAPKKGFWRTLKEYVTN